MARPLGILPQGLPANPGLGPTEPRPRLAYSVKPWENMACWHLQVGSCGSHPVNPGPGVGTLVSLVRTKLISQLDSNRCFHFFPMPSLNGFPDRDSSTGQGVLRLGKYIKTRGLAAP